MNKVFKSWLFEASKAIPLFAAIVMIASRDMIIAIGFSILVLYVAHLYDLKWQTKLANRDLHD